MSEPEKEAGVGPADYADPRRAVAYFVIPLLTRLANENLHGNGGIDNVPPVFRWLHGEFHWTDDLERKCYLRSLFLHLKGEFHGDPASLPDIPVVSEEPTDFSIFER